jgi:hypothetical protein
MALISFIICNERGNTISYWSGVDWCRGREEMGGATEGEKSGTKPGKIGYPPSFRICTSAGFEKLCHAVSNDL